MSDFYDFVLTFPPFFLGVFGGLERVKYPSSLRGKGFTYFSQTEVLGTIMYSLKSIIKLMPYAANTSIATKCQNFQRENIISV